MTKTIGFVGLGRMGLPMARHLLDYGGKLIAYDTVPVAMGSLVGAERVESLKRLGEQCEIVFTSLPDGHVVKEVILGEEGILSGDSVTRTFVDLSTIGAKASIEIASQLAPRGIDWVEAPVSGGPIGAQNATLAVMVSGSSASISDARQYLDLLGKVFVVGSTYGGAQTAKLANNMLSSAAVVLTSEVMVMAAKAGVDANILLEIINAGSGRNSATVDKFPRSVVTRTFDYGFSTGLAYKDVRMCVDEAQSLGVPMLAGSIVGQMLAACAASFGSSSDFTSVVRLYEQWAGVEVGR
ncbi:NAD(P)-dependent oxidoreductase [Aminobacter sp. MSH1]|uniref:NAD(P)-dependent oxidoreductase n=1 Tax=Aminobacter sp. MSH1 TaxID=374606 RepID=UPI000D34817D|nr:NAD(P)-dependent oxidoreductase [Aminobacter sp. MSH1]